MTRISDDERRARKAAAVRAKRKIDPTYGGHKYIPHPRVKKVFYIPHPRPKKTKEEIASTRNKWANLPHNRIKLNAKAAARMHCLRADPVKGPILKAAALKRLNKWRTEHPEKVREMNRMARLRRDKATTGTVNVSYWFATLAAFDNKCAVCGDGSNGLHRDHWIPISRGGKHENGNMIPLCPKCNRDKTNHFPHQWLVMKEHGLATLARIETERRRLEAHGQWRTGGVQEKS